MGLKNTTSSVTSMIPSPVLHAYSSERTGTEYEEAAYWNTQWGTPMGANETTNISDLARTAVEVGTGALLTKASYKATTAPNLLGFGHALPACAGSCFTQINAYNYGLGVVRSGSWLLQNPLLSGQGATEAYLPSKKIAIAVAVTFLPQAFQSDGSYPNASDTLFRTIGKYLAPADAPPTH